MRSMETIPTPLESELTVSHAAVIALPEADALHACKILMIDGEEPKQRLLERVLVQAGLDNFISLARGSGFGSEVTSSILKSVEDGGFRRVLGP